MAVIAIAGDHAVLADGHRRLKPDGDRFLADVEVAEAADQPQPVELPSPFLEAPDQKHLAIELQEIVLGRLVALGLRRPRNIVGVCFGNGGVCLTYLGDGAVNQGQVYEAFNMAKLWDLPVIYAIENNQYAMGTSIKRSSSEPMLYRRGESHRIPGLQVDGMDVLAVRGAADVALEWTRSGKGPIIIEFLTYRYRGHSMSDPAKYRTREEVQDVREHRDPISHCERDLLGLGVKEEELKAIDKEIKDIVVGAAKFAEDAPEPAPSELFTDVLVESY
jgi:TPP-dependent pyruvate/acetoin dehydrogenase alpha subunit